MNRDQANAELEAARSALLQLENRLATGDPVSMTERQAVNERYAEASNAVEFFDAEERRARMRAAGVEPGPDQGLAMTSGES